MAKLAASLLATMVISTMVVAPSASANTVLSVGGTGAGSAATRPVNMDWLNHLGPATQVGYPAQFLPMGPSIQTGADNLAAQVALIEGPITIVGGSQGALVVEEYKRRLMVDPNARTDITFIEYADPASKYGLFAHNPGIQIPGMDITTSGPVDTPYQTTVIARQYDGAADWPDQQWNLLADVNAIFGFIYLHPHYGNVDTTGMTPYDVDGNTTYYRIPTAHLPLLQPLRDLGVDQGLLNMIEGPLRQIIDSAYNHPHPAQQAATVAPGPRKDAVKVAPVKAEPTKDATQADPVKPVKDEDVKKPDKPRHRKVRSEDAESTTSPRTHDRPKSGSVPHHRYTHTNSPTEGETHEDHHRKPVHRAERPDHRPVGSKLGRH